MKILLSLLFASSILVCGVYGKPPSESLRKGAHPVVILDSNKTGLLLGGTIDGTWVQAKTMARRLRGGEKYRLYSESYIRTERAGKPRLEDGHYPLSLASDDEAVLAIKADWNVIPRKPKSVGVQPYIKYVKTMLISKGLSESEVDITEAKKVDLEGDGHDEVIISAISKTFEGYVGKKGEYSLVMLHREGVTSKDILIAGVFITQPASVEFPVMYGSNFGKSGIYTWDLDGDGNLEIGVDWFCPKADAAGLAFYDVNGSKLKLLARDGVGH